MSESPEAVNRFPLEWPAGWVRTLSSRRQRADFSQTKTDVVGPAEQRRQVKRSVPVTVFVAVQRLEKELDRLGATNPTLSSNLSLRLDGRPRSEGEPADPGVAVYFRFKARATVFACDRYVRVADNIAAIAAHIDALRRIERYGVGSLEQALAGYKALPVDSASDWRQVFGFTKTEHVTEDQLQNRWRDRSKSAHPDKGGSDEMQMHVNRARDYALAELHG